MSDTHTQFRYLNSLNLILELVAHIVDIKSENNGAHGRSKRSNDKGSKRSTMGEGVSQRSWVKQDGIQISCDCQSAIYLAKHQVYHTRAKHIDVRFHKIK